MTESPTLAGLGGTSFGVAAGRALRPIERAAVRRASGGLTFDTAATPNCSKVIEAGLARYGGGCLEARSGSLNNKGWHLLLSLLRLRAFRTRHTTIPRSRVPFRLHL